MSGSCTAPAVLTHTAPASSASPRLLIMFSPRGPLYEIVVAQSPSTAWEALPRESPLRQAEFARSAGRGASPDVRCDPPRRAAGVLHAATLVGIALLHGRLHRRCPGVERAPIGRVHVFH